MCPACAKQLHEIAVSIGERTDECTHSCASIDGQMTYSSGGHAPQEETSQSPLRRVAVALEGYCTRGTYISNEQNNEHNQYVWGVLVFSVEGAGIPRHKVLYSFFPQGGERLLPRHQTNNSSPQNEPDK